MRCGVRRRRRPLLAACTTSCSGCARHSGTARSSRTGAATGCGSPTVELDVQRFDALIKQGQDALVEGDAERAAALLDQGLALWRGAPLADLADAPFAEREIARLEESRVTAVEQRIEARLALGRHAEVVGELEALVREHPYRERLWAQLMLALYRCDRQADALQAYQHARRTLVDELGIEPGERLRELERAVLAQDHALSLPAAVPAELPPELDTRMLLVGRDADLDRLRGQWHRARDGAGRLVLVAGARGIGKTRLAAELAREVQRDGGTVRYVSCAGPPDAMGAALAHARGARRPTLLVVDDLDRAGEEIRAALGELGLAALPVLVLATAADPALAGPLRADATVTLAPLAADGVRAVARLYAGPREDVEIPVEQLIAASGGIPARLHRAAREWARTESARRVGAAADHTASERTGLRAAEAELAGNVIELQAFRERGEPQDGGPGVVVCPFKGLASFDIDDAEFFFGRESLVAEMVARLVGAPLLGVVGPSGSGKSSALRAGLLAALATGVLPGSERWPVVLLRPGEHPLAALEEAIARRRAGSARDRGRPVRGDVHRLPRRVGAGRVHRRAARVCARGAAARAGADRGARRLLRALRRVSGAGAAAGRQPRAGGTDAPRRAAPRDRAARPARGPAHRARARRCARRRCRG